VPFQVDLPPEALIVRFRPSKPEDVFNAAEKAFRYYSAYRLSCFADVKQPDEDDDAVIRRLIGVAQLGGLDIRKHKNCWYARSGDLQDVGVTFWKDEDDDEEPEHYSFDLGTTLTPERVEQVLNLFAGPERTGA